MSKTPESGETESAEAPAGGSGFLTGLFLGLLIGAALAIIAAPQTGEETRDLLRAKAREVADRARDTADDVSETVSGTTTDLIERGRTIVDAARTRIDGAIAEGVEAAEQQRTELEKQA